MNYSDSGSNLTNQINLEKDEAQQSKDQAKIEKLAKRLKQSDIVAFEEVQNSDRIMEIEDERIPLEEIRSRLPTVWDQYKFITEAEKIYLPRWENISHKPKWASEKYLVGVMLKKYFGLKRELIRKPVSVVKRQTKGELVKILEGLVKKPLGFDMDRKPPKKWLVKIIYSLNPNHEIFQPATEKIMKLIPKE